MQIKEISLRNEHSCWNPRINYPDERTHLGGWVALVVARRLGSGQLGLAPDSKSYHSYKAFFLAYFFSQSIKIIFLILFCLEILWSNILCKS